VILLQVLITTILVDYFSWKTIKTDVSFKIHKIFPCKLILCTWARKLSWYWSDLQVVIRFSDVGRLYFIHFVSNQKSVLLKISLTRRLLPQILSIYYSHTLMISDAWAYRYKNKYLQFFAILSSMLIFEERFHPLTLVIRKRRVFDILKEICLLEFSSF